MFNISKKTRRTDEHRMTAYTACIASRGKNHHFYVPRPSLFVPPGDAFAIITQYVAWMERQFSACQTPRSMYLSIFKSFRVIRCLSQCVSPKIAIFTYRSLHFSFPWRHPCDYHAICCMDVKTIQCLPNPSQHVSIYLQQFHSYSNRKCKKISVFMYHSPHFCSPWRRLCDHHAICCMDGKTIQCLPNPSQHIPIYL